MKTAAQLASEKGLPSSIESEQFVLGSILLKRSLPPETQSLSPQDFSVEKHRKIFHVMLALQDLQRPVEYLTVAQLLEDRGALESVGGRAYVAFLTDGLPNLSSIATYVEVVREKSVLRQLAFLGQNICSQAIECQPSTEIIQQATSRLENLQVGDALDAERFTLKSLDREYQEFADHIDERRIRLGMGPFDELTGGVSFGEVVTIIARTGVGKSAVAQNIITHVLRTYPESGVVFFSVEMPRLQAYERALQIYAGVGREKPLYAYRNSEKGKVRADEFVRKFNNRLLISDDTNLGLDGMKRFVRGAEAAKLIRPVGLVAIDYLGLLDRGDRKASLTERVSVLARGVKQIAKELETVVVLLAQTSRSAGDGSEEVTVVDARDSGAIEDSADFLLGCWRPSLKKGITADKYAESRADLCFSILKNRRGPRDRFTVTFDVDTLRVNSPGQAS